MQLTSRVPEHANLAFEGEIFDVFQWEQEMYDGTTKIFERLRRPDTVAVIPVLKNGDLVILEEEQPWQDKHVTFPTGRMEKGETPDQAGARELLEETGLTPTSLLPLMAYQPVAKMEWTVHVMAAMGCEKNHDQHFDGGEKITVKTVTFQKLLDMAADGSLPYSHLTCQLLRAQLDPARMADLRAKLGL